MGSASPAPAPAAKPRGELPGTVIDSPAVRDLDATGELIAVRTDSALTVGTLDEITRGGATTYQLDERCGEASGNAGAFAVGCGDTIRIFRADGEETIATDKPVIAATVTTTGEVLAGSDSERSMWLYRNGELAKTFPVARETDQLQAVPVDGQADTVVRINRFDTTIQDMDWQGARQGGTLRAGLGVGKIAGGEHGLVLAADSTGSQLLVYTSDDIIRLHQTSPVAGGPWDVAWDPAAKLAWVSATGANRAYGYDIASGVPRERAGIDTVADPQSIVVLDDGTLIIASASGDGLQVVGGVDKQVRELPKENR